MDHNIIRSLWTVPRLLLNDDPPLSLETHASSAEVPNTLPSTAPSTSVGDAIGRPLDITNTNARNTRKTSLMFSKIALITTITYLLTQTITYPGNAESSTKEQPYALFPSYTSSPLEISSLNDVLSYCFRYSLFFILIPTHQQSPSVLPPWRRPLYYHEGHSVLCPQVFL